MDLAIARNRRPWRAIGGSVQCVQSYFGAIKHRSMMRANISLRASALC
jgi:hypothetical protein